MDKTASWHLSNGNTVTLVPHLRILIGGEGVEKERENKHFSRQWYDFMKNFFDLVIFKLDLNNHSEYKLTFFAWTTG